MPKIKSNYLNIYYEIYGDGFPLIFINGQSGTVAHFKNSPLFKDFERSIFTKFKTIFFDNRGIGKTDDVDRQYTIKTLADDVKGLIDALNLGKVNIIGFSMGGMIAQELIINYPEIIEKSVIGATHCGISKYILPSQEVTNIMMKNQEGLSPEEIVKSQIPLIYTEEFIKNNSDFIESTIQYYISNPVSPKVYQKQVYAILRFKSCRRLKIIQVPTLILHGKCDLLVPPQNGEILADLIPGSKLKIFENSGHNLCVDQTEVFLSTIIDFFD